MEDVEVETLKRLIEDETGYFKDLIEWASMIVDFDNPNLWRMRRLKGSLRRNLDHKAIELNELRKHAKTETKEFKEKSKAYWKYLFFYIEVRDAIRELEKS